MKTLKIFLICDSVSLYLVVRDTEKSRNFISFYACIFPFLSLSLLQINIAKKSFPKFYPFGCLDENRIPIQARSGWWKWKGYSAFLELPIQLEVLEYSHSICSHAVTNNFLKQEQNRKWKKEWRGKSLTNHSPWGMENRIPLMVSLFFGIFNETKSWEFPVSGWCFGGLISTCPWLWKERSANFPRSPYYHLLLFSSQKKIFVIFLTGKVKSREPKRPV